MTTVVESSTPTSWNDAARTCVSEICSQFMMTGSLVEMRNHIDHMIDVAMGRRRGDKNFEDFVSESGAGLWADYWMTFGSFALNAGQKLGFFTKFSNWPQGQEAVDRQIFIDDIASLLVRKQKDYGHENISRCGRTGLLVRCHDKVARLENLEAKGVNPQNESVVDNSMDVIGYAAIGMMWERGWFKLNLV